jgi:hypothetical protein
MSRQIKEAYLYRHRLQMREKQIQNSKQRLTGYIFHEVRVPLNTASKLGIYHIRIWDLIVSCSVGSAEYRGVGHGFKTSGAGVQRSVGQFDRHVQRLVTFSLMCIFSRVFQC